MILQAAPTVAFCYTVGYPIPLMPISSLQVHVRKAESKVVDNLDDVCLNQKHVSKGNSPMLSMLCLAGELAEVTLQSLESLHGDSTAQWLYRLARGCDTEEVCTSHSCTDHQLA